MPDRRSHRGPHPLDRRLFGAAALPALRDAAADYCWLLNRGYPPASSLALVGNRYRLKQRQRIAVSRWACSDDALAHRAARCITPGDIAGKELLLDGFNVLTTVEAALGGGVVLACRDGCFRDMASMHGTFRQVAESRPALLLVGQTLHRLNVGGCGWLFDRPVSNSGRLADLCRAIAADNGWPWRAELVDDPDRAILQSASITATADSGILDACGGWFNLARLVVEQHAAQAWIVDLAV